jgi:hypothetical protein
MAGSCKRGNEPSGSAEGVEFINRVTIKFSGRTVLRGVNKLNSNFYYIFCSFYTLLL